MEDLDDLEEGNVEGLRPIRVLVIFSMLESDQA